MCSQLLFSPRVSGQFGCVDVCGPRQAQCSRVRLLNEQRPLVESRAQVRERRLLILS